MRLVDSLQEAEQAFGQGDRPLWVGSSADVDPTMLRQLQEEQWAAPGGVPLFTEQGINPEHPHGGLYQRNRHLLQSLLGE
jgi:hypothetical protein